jgi:hypothetical protein
MNVEGKVLKKIKCEEAQRNNHCIQLDTSMSSHTFSACIFEDGQPVSRCQ